MNKMTFLELTLHIETIIIGESFKGGTYRPCLETIPESTIEGALYHHFGMSLPAVGYFEEGSYLPKEFTYSLRDKVLESATLPVATVYLAPNPEKGASIRAKVYIPHSAGQAWEAELENAQFRMGALRNKGFGQCRVHAVERQEFDVVQGRLKVRLFENRLSQFGIDALAPCYGYLFQLTPGAYYGGAYTRALFAGSLVKAPRMLLQEETYYDEYNRRGLEKGFE